MDEPHIVIIKQTEPCGPFVVVAVVEPCPEPEPPDTVHTLWGRLPLCILEAQPDEIPIWPR